MLVVHGVCKDWEESVDSGGLHLGWHVPTGVLGALLQDKARQKVLVRVADGSGSGSLVLQSLTLCGIDNRRFGFVAAVIHLLSITQLLTMVDGVAQWFALLMPPT